MPKCSDEMRSPSSLVNESRVNPLREEFEAVPAVSYEDFEEISPEKRSNSSNGTPENCDSEVPLWSSNTAISMARKVLHIVQSHYRLKPQALALSVASFLRDVCGMNVRLYTDVPAKQNIPPCWINSFFIINVNDHCSPICVDCDFQSKFLVARPTEKYVKFLETCVPVVYVGVLQKLKSDVDTVMEALQQCLVDSGLAIAPWRTPERVKEIYELCIRSSQWHEPGDQLLLEVERGLYCDQYSAIPKEATSPSSSPSPSIVFTAIAVRSTLLQGGLAMGSVPCTPTSPPRITYTGKDYEADNYEFEKDEPSVAQPINEPSGISLLFKGNSSSQSTGFHLIKLFSLERKSLMD